MSFKSVEEVQEANEKVGQHWFESPYDLQAESSVLHDDSGSAYFVISEVYLSGLRTYLICVADRSGWVNEVGNTAFEGAHEAWEALEEHIEHVNAYRACKACQ